MDMAVPFSGEDNWYIIYILDNPLNRPEPGPSNSLPADSGGSGLWTGDLGATSSFLLSQDHRSPPSRRLTAGAGRWPGEISPTRLRWPPGIRFRHSDGGTFKTWTGSCAALIQEVENERNKLGHRTFLPYDRRRGGVLPGRERHPIQTPPPSGCWAGTIAVGGEEDLRHALR